MSLGPAPQREGERDPNGARCPVQQAVGDGHRKRVLGWVEAESRVRENRLGSAALEQGWP